MIANPNMLFILSHVLNARSSLWHKLTEVWERHSRSIWQLSVIELQISQQEDISLCQVISQSKGTEQRNKINDSCIKMNIYMLNIIQLEWNMHLPLPLVWLQQVGHAISVLLVLTENLLWLHTNGNITVGMDNVSLTWVIQYFLVH